MFHASEGSNWGHHQACLEGEAFLDSPRTKPWGGGIHASVVFIVLGEGTRSTAGSISCGSILDLSVCSLKHEQAEPILALGRQTFEQRNVALVLGLFCASRDEIRWTSGFIACL